MSQHAVSPQVAIGIATRNAAQGLALTLNSIAAQSCKNAIEVVVQDDESVDHTLDVARSYAAQLPLLRMDSSPDDGVYDAWLKVIPSVRAPWILFLGAGDTLAYPETIQTVVAQLKQCPDDKYFALGQVTILSAEREPLHSVPNNIGQMSAVLPHYNPIYHAGVFTRSEFLKANPFDASFKILGDYDFFCRHWENGVKAWQIHCLIAEAPLGGLSNSSKFRAYHDVEIRRIRKGYFPRQYWRSRLYQTCAAVLPKGCRRLVPVFVKQQLKKFLKLA